LKLSQLFNELIFTQLINRNGPMKESSFLTFIADRADNPPVAKPVAGGSSPTAHEVTSHSNDKIWKDRNSSSSCDGSVARSLSLSCSDLLCFSPLAWHEIFAFAMPQPSQVEVPTQPISTLEAGKPLCIYPQLDLLSHFLLFWSGEGVNA
jgi:hypothetical protein